jgi:hypothetical protein
MSWQTCYNSSNNTNFNFPPIMNDGRNFATWQPESVVNERIQQKEGITSNWNYRIYLQQNAQQIMNYNNQEYCYSLGMDPHYNTDDTPSKNVPHTFKNTFDTSVPGFGYSNSDLKQPYLSREQLNARLVSPSVNMNSNTNVNEKSYKRVK